jgi:hypothetical protein
MPWSPGADHAHALVGDLIAVADRAIADQALGQRRIVQLARDIGAVVDHSGGEQHRPCADCPVAHPHDEAIAIALNCGNLRLLTHRAEALGLTAHQEQ